MDTNTAHSHAEEHHGLPASGYGIVLVILLFLTGLTYYTGRMMAPLPGSWNLIVAMVIAVAKATIVCLFFMHLWGDSRANQLIVIVASLFVVLLCFMTILDVNTRFPLSAPPGSARAQVNTANTLD